MTAVDVLERCLRAGREIEKQKQRITQLRESAGIASVRMDADGGGKGSGPRDRLGDIACEIAAAEERLGLMQRRYEAEVLAANKVLWLLEDAESSVLFRVYICNLSLSATASALNYSLGYVKTKKREALEKLAEIQADEYLPEWYRE